MELNKDMSARSVYTVYCDVVKEEVEIIEGFKTIYAGRPPVPIDLEPTGLACPYSWHCWQREKSCPHKILGDKPPPKILLSYYYK